MSVNVDHAWGLSLQISVRDRCRLYERRNGCLVNSTHDAPMSGTVPGVPWAVYLADGTSYHLICLDVDCHDGDQGETARQARAIRQLLTEQGISSLECVSGPHGGRHVWAASLDALPADLVATLARALRLRFERLDISCLTNPVTGCARPPYSPHRDGGTSRIVAGDTDCLEMPESRYTDWERLTRKAAGTALAARKNRIHGAAASDGRGHPWIPGIRKPLSQRTTSLLETPLQEHEDASARQWRILLAMAAAHWTFDHALEHLHQPGLSHAASRSEHGRRIPRPPSGSRSSRAVLAADWRRAIDAARRDPQGADPTFEPRALEIAILVDATLRTARARPGRWSRPGGASELRVLTALCRRALMAVRDTIEASIRTLALDTGLGRETVRTALQRLAADHWISLETHAGDEHANQWKISRNHAYPQSMNQGRSQVNTPPANAGRILREHLLGRLSAWLAISGHDAHQKTEQHLREGNHLASGKPLTRRLLRALDRIALRRGTLGVTRSRRKRYETERLAWEWWRTEQAWMGSPSGTQQPRRTLSLPGILHGAWPPMPRTGRRIDWRTSMRTVESLAKTNISKSGRNRHVPSEPTDTRRKQ